MKKRIIFFVLLLLLVFAVTFTLRNLIPENESTEGPLPAPSPTSETLPPNPAPAPPEPNTEVTTSPHTEVKTPPAPLPTPVLKPSAKETSSGLLKDLGEEGADDDLAFEQPTERAEPNPTETSALSSEKTPATKSNAKEGSTKDSLKKIIEGAQAITNVSQETESSEISGVWEGIVKTGNANTPLILNRIWDQLTDEYLPTSCVGLLFNRTTAVSAYLRNSALNFYEKEAQPRNKLIAKIKGRYLLELTAPMAGRNSTTGNFYEIKGDKLSLMGSVSLEKRVGATADIDCDSLD